MYSLQKISGQKKISKFNAITRLKQFSVVYSQILSSIIHVVSIKEFQILFGKGVPNFQISYFSEFVFCIQFGPFFLC